MCIICECSNDGDRFLTEFERARSHMRAAADRMKDCSRSASTKDARRRYDRAHKRMVRIIRDWNRIEQEREAE